MRERDEDEPATPRRAGIDGEAERDQRRDARPRGRRAAAAHRTSALRGPLRARQGARSRYEHILVDEAQDLSPVELAVVLATTAEPTSVTLAGDVAQRLHHGQRLHGLGAACSAELGLSHVESSRCKLSYRSTHEIIEFAHQVLGPLAHRRRRRKATRHGAPVELFRFAHTRRRRGLPGESLRELTRREPRASIAVIARYPEQARPLLPRAS